MKLRVLVACEMSGRVRDQFAARGWEAWSADLLESETCPRIRSTLAKGTTDVTGCEHGNHYVGDVRDLFVKRHPVNYLAHLERQHYRKRLPNGRVPLWDLIIAHPPCTDLSYAGAVWFKYKDARRGGDGRMQAAAKFFGEMLDAPSHLVAVENPHSIAQEFFGLPTQTVHPWMFGDPFVKRIDLWLKGLPSLIPAYREEDYPGLLTRVTTGGGSWRTDKNLNRQRMSAYEDSEGRKNRAKVRSRTLPGIAFHIAAQWGNFAEEYYAGR